MRKIGNFLSTVTLLLISIIITSTNPPLRAASVHPHGRMYPSLKNGQVSVHLRLLRTIPSFLRGRGRKTRPRSDGPLSLSQTPSIIHRDSDILLGPEVAFGGLN
jgi:hypothetical protein